MPTPFMPTPSHCDKCDLPFGQKAGTIMYDACSEGRQGNPWGCFCDRPGCKPEGGYPLGLGLGQKYERSADGSFYQIGGGTTK